MQTCCKTSLSNHRTAGHSFCENLPTAPRAQSNVTTFGGRGGDVPAFPAWTERGHACPRMRPVCSGSPQHVQPRPGFSTGARPFHGVLSLEQPIYYTVWNDEVAMSINLQVYVATLCIISRLCCCSNCSHNHPTRQASSCAHLFSIVL